MSFTAGVHWDDSMFMNNYVIKLYLITNCVDSASQNVALNRIKHFVYSELSNTIFINNTYVDRCQLYADAGLKITTLPAEPVDQIIGIMLYSKLNAIMENRMIINELSINSELGDHVSYLHAFDENLGEFAESGWWQDADLIHYDPTLIDSNKVVTMPHAVWQELNLAWPIPVTDTPDNNNVVFAEFKKDESK
jgi:hypothetical protein